MPKRTSMVDCVKPVCKKDPNKLNRYWPSRNEQLKEQLPDFYKWIRYKKVLYVGARPGRMQGFREMQDANAEITILEVWEENAVPLKEAGKEVVIGDIRDARSLFKRNSFDCTFFWHGPEHLAPQEFDEVIGGIETVTKTLVIFGCPWGWNFQDAVNGNPYEMHLSHLYPRDLRKLDYHTHTIGSMNEDGSNILSWKIKVPTKKMSTVS